MYVTGHKCRLEYSHRATVDKQHRGRSRGRVQGVRTPPPRDDLRFSNTTSILQKKKAMWFIGVEVEQETSAPAPKNNPGSAPATIRMSVF